MAEKVAPASPRRSPGILPWIGGAVVAGAAAFFLWPSDPPKKPTREAPAATTEAREPERVREPSEPTASSKRRAPNPAAEVDEEAPPPDEATEAPPNADPGSEEVQRVRDARKDRTPEGTKALIASLISEDEVVVAEAANALVARRATEAIAPLSKIDLTNAAGSGLSIIDALGRLGGLAEGTEKDAAVDRLIAMLAEEKKRDARESPANLLQIYEALGETRDPRAAPPLDKELLDPAVPRAPKVVIVNAIVKIGEKASRLALTTARRDQVAAVGADAFEEEIRKELVGVIDAALEKL